MVFCPISLKEPSHTHLGLGNPEEWPYISRNRHRHSYPYEMILRTCSQKRPFDAGSG